MNAIYFAVPISLTLTVCVGLWRLVRRLETPVVQLVVDMQNTVKTTQLLIEQVHRNMETVQIAVEDVDKTILSANEMIHDVDKTILSTNEMITDIREPFKKMLVTTEETVRNVDHAMEVLQLHALKQSISNMGSGLFNVILCRHHLKDVKEHEKSIDERIIAKVAFNNQSPVSPQSHSPSPQNCQEKTDEKNKTKDNRNIKILKNF